MVAVTLDLSEWIALTSAIVLIAAYLVRREMDFRSLRADVTNQKARLGVVIMYMAEIMDRDKALKFTQEIYREHGR
jgi:predicted metallo-beta-lactamase superfamily hydrolase